MAAASPAPAGAALDAGTADALRQAGSALVTGDIAGVLADAATLVDTEEKQATVADAVDTFLTERRITATGDVVAQLRSVHGSIPVWFVQTMHNVLHRLQVWWRNDDPTQEDPVLAQWLKTLHDTAWPPAVYQADHTLVPGVSVQDAHRAAHQACLPLAQQWHDICSVQDWYGTVGRSRWEDVVKYMDAAPDDFVARLLTAVGAQEKYAEMDAPGRANLWAELTRSLSLLRLWSVVPDSLTTALVQVMHGVQEGGQIRLGTLFEWLSHIRQRVPSSEIAGMLRNLADTTRDMGGAEFLMHMLKLSPKALSMEARTQFEGLLSHVLTMLARISPTDVDGVASILDSPTQRQALEEQLEGSLTDHAASLGGSRSIVSFVAQAAQDPGGALDSVIDMYAPTPKVSRHTADQL